MPRSEHRFNTPAKQDYSGRHQIRVRFETDGNVVMAFMLQYETFLDGVWWPVVRYDTSHGEAHRDIYDASGEQVDKQWLGVTEPPFNTVMTSSYEELQQTWSRYFQAFLDRRRRRE